jgi:hypothetical protein
MASYSKSSPWANTKVNVGNYLDLYVKRSIPPQADDILYVIQPQYTYRPDLLAFDLYGSSKLWWVFAVRNIEVIKDPLFDFVSGNQIYLPKKSTLTTVIGI